MSSFIQMLFNSIANHLIWNEQTKKPMLNFQIPIKSQITQTSTQIPYQICKKNNNNNNNQNHS